MSNTKNYSKHLIGKKIFTVEDQQFFSRLSGDSNPLHMDATYARRMLNGKNAVHGIHVVLWAMEYWLQHNAGACQMLQCVFKKPVSVGDSITFFQQAESAEKFVIRVYVEDLLCAKIRIVTSACEAEAKSVYEDEDRHEVKFEQVKIPGAPIDVPMDSQLGNKYQVLLEENHLADRFVLICSRMGFWHVIALSSMSAFFGMICPGLHSLLSSFKIIFINNKTHAVPSLYYSIDQYDDRFNMLDVTVSGFFVGHITVFRRLELVSQLLVENLQHHIVPGEFSGLRSLVVGGSRGLGEFTAKAMVAGGATVLLTYVDGEADARKVSDELNRYSPSSSQIKRFNVLDDPRRYFSPDEIASFSIIYFFASPRIFVSRSGAFDKRLFDHFFAVYVTAFYRLADYCEEACNQSVTIFMPSSAAVTESPDELIEYAAAKKCAEMLADAINHSYERVTVLFSRLPRLETDQTTTIAYFKTESTVDTLLPIIRSVCRATKNH